MSIEKQDKHGPENEGEKIPTGREIGEKISRDDLITIGAISSTVSLILETEKITAEGDIPSYTWLQEIDINGDIIAEPHMGPPVRMQVFPASTLFDAAEKLNEEE